MFVRVKFTNKFKKQYKKTPAKIKRVFRKRLELFQKDSDNKILINHVLSGRLRGFRSINITGDWRAIYRVETKSKLVVFVAIGTHSQLYG